MNTKILILNNTSKLSPAAFKGCKAIVLSYNFLTIYGLPFCSLYTKKLLKLYPSLTVALNVTKEQGTATLAIIENFPNLIIDSSCKEELTVIKQNSNSGTKLFNSVKEFQLFAVKQSCF